MAIICTCIDAIVLFVYTELPIFAVIYHQIMADIFVNDLFIYSSADGICLKSTNS